MVTASRVSVGSGSTSGGGGEGGERGADVLDRRVSSERREPGAVRESDGDDAEDGVVL